MRTQEQRAFDAGLSDATSSLGVDWTYLASMIIGFDRKGEARAYADGVALGVFLGWVVP